MTKEYFKRKWISYLPSMDMWENFGLDLNELLRVTREEGIESGKIIERHGSESYIE